MNEQKPVMADKKEAVLRRFLIALVAMFLAASCSPYVQTATETPTIAPSPLYVANSPTVAPTVEPSPTPQTCTVETGVPDGFLNLRAGKGTSYAVVKVLDEGEILTVIADGAWLEVDADGKHGFINSRYCE